MRSKANSRAGAAQGRANDALRHGARGWVISVPKAMVGSVAPIVMGLDRVTCGHWSRDACAGRRFTVRAGRI